MTARRDVQIDFEKYVNNVFRFALSLSNDWHIAEDLTQECLLRAHQRQHQLQSAEGARPWMFRIVLNLWKDRLKKKRIKATDALDMNMFGRDWSPEEALMQRESCQQIVQLMQSLPDQQRSVLYLSSVEQFSIREIAGLIKSSENSVKANLSIARKTLRKKLVRQVKQQESPIE